MMSAASAENLLSWAAQVFVLASAGVLLPRMFRLRHPRSHLIYCHLVLIACLVLPIVQPWHQELIVVGNESQPRVSRIETPSIAIDQTEAGAAVSWQIVIGWILAIGIAAKLCWFAAGLWQISRYRAAARLLYPNPQSITEACRITKSTARFCVSTAVPGPVTFGFLSPIILLPESFLTLRHEEQRAIACHELLHVQRRDWLVTLGEEFLSVLFWFHPAVWWLLAQTRLAREQLVDTLVVRLTDAREPYIDALLAMAGAKPHLDLAPAPLFLRRRHLIQRMDSLLSEVPMSRLRLVCSYGLMAFVLAGAVWAALVSFPLAGEAQIQVIPPGAVPDGPGVTVNSGGNVLRRTPIMYPFDAQQKRVEGSVFVELSVNKNGEVTDARIMSGPEELRKAVLQSALQWRYAADSAPAGTIVASVQFRVPLAPPAPAPLVTQPGQRGNGSLLQGQLTNIDTSALDEPLRTQLAQQLQRFQGQQMTQLLVDQISEIVKTATPPGTTRAAVQWGTSANRVDKTLRIRPLVPPPPPPPPPAPGTPQRVRVGGNVAASNLVQQVNPEYPPLAKQARIQGVVVLEAVISAEGIVTGLQVVTGHPLLIQSAMDAVKQWVYRPTLLNGQPIEVVTTITVNFSFQEQ
jgi:TonB family protein